MMKNIKAENIDNIVAGRFYCILNSEHEKHSKLVGQPFEVLGVSFPFICTSVGILDLRECDLLALSDEYTNAAKGKHVIFDTTPLVFKQQDISPWW